MQIFTIQAKEEVIFITTFKKEKMMNLQQNKEYNSGIGIISQKPKTPKRVWTTETGFGLAYE